MLKKFISCLLCLLLLPYAAFAEIKTPVDINSEEKIFTVTGTSDVINGELLLIVTKPNVDISDLTPALVAANAVVVYALETDSEGGYSGQFYLPDEALSGDYTVYVGPGDSASFYYASETEINSCVDTIAESNISNIGSNLYYYTVTQKILGLDLGGDYAAYSDAANSVMIDYITQSKPADISTIKDYFAKATQAGVLIKSTSTNKIKALFDENKLDLSVDSGVSSDALVNMYLTLRDSSVKTTSKIANTLRCAEALCKINSATRGVMDSVLTEYNDVLLLNLSGDYASLDKVEVNKALVNKGFTSIHAVQTAFVNSVTLVKGQNNDDSTTTTNTPGNINSTITASGVGTSSGSASGGGAGALPPVDTTPSPLFNDLHDAEWASDYINILAAKNIVNGVGNGSFDPNGVVTREQYVKMLLGAFNISTSNSETSFADVDSSMWYASFVSTAYAQGIISGVSETEFGIGAPVTREQMAVMSVRLMEKYGISLNTSALGFADRAEISSYAYDAVSKLTASGIINGIDSSSFAPKANLTRAQAAKVIYLIMKAGGYIA